MHQLQLALDEDPELRAQIATLSQSIAENPLKHALVLDLNLFWDSARRWEAAGLPERLLLDWYDRHHFSFGALPLPPNPGLADLSRRYKVADYLTNRVFGDRQRSTPYMLRIFAAPARSKGEFERRDQLVAAARAASLPTIVETEERARFIAGPGDWLTGGSGSGTLGGFLKDGSYGPTYAVTCGHVVSSGAVSTSAGHLGTCSHAKVPTPLPAASMCTTGCPHMTKLDVALIDVGSAAVANVATSEARVVARGDLVEMHGSVSGKRTYEVGGTVIELDVAGSCWDRLYLIHAPTTGILPLGVNIATHPLPRRGDSGAWLLRNSTEWAGMVVASAGLHGYALPATVVLSESDQSFNTSLQLA